jgi:hypothetical protein
MFAQNYMKMGGIGIALGESESECAAMWPSMGYDENTDSCVALEDPGWKKDCPPGQVWRAADNTCFVPGTEPMRCPGWQPYLGDDGQCYESEAAAVAVGQKQVPYSVKHEVSQATAAATIGIGALLLLLFL